jgi:hypothetical protein
MTYDVTRKLMFIFYFISQPRTISTVEGGGLKLKIKFGK